jgi:hypothetical protein
LQGRPGIAQSHFVGNVQGHNTVDRKELRKRCLAYVDLGNFAVNPCAVKRRRSVRNIHGAGRRPVRILRHDDPRDCLAELLLVRYYPSAR